MEKSKLEAALDLAKMGFHVFPVKPNSKVPAIEDWPDLATRDPEKIKKFWSKGEYNIGMSTSCYGDGEHLVVIDVDNKNGKDGDAALISLELDGFEVPKTFCQVTPNGGRHIVYKTKRALKSGVDILGKGLDIRASRAQILGAGSIIDGRLYKINNSAAVMPAPKWLEDRLGEDRAKTKPPEDQKVPTGIDRTAALERALHYLRNEAPIAVEGRGGDQTTFRVAARIKDFGLSANDALEVLLIHWNPSCIPPWDPQELERKVQHAYRYGSEPIGAAAPETQFEKIPTEPELSELEKLNQDYALVYADGSHFIMHNTVDKKGHKTLKFLSEATFKRRFSPVKILTERGGRRCIADAWLDWKGRREYAGLIFAPEREPKFNYYNLWKGFTCKPLDPKEGTARQRRGLDMFLEHAHENVCRGEDTLFHWLMGYFAHLIQKPYERPLTTLVFQGTKGTGKNTLVDRVGNLLGRDHYMVAHDGRYLTSNFNGHLERCLMLALDEAFWSGDKTAEGKLKGLTTAPEILIERKGREPYLVDNLVRLVVIGNEDWLVPASHDERRYAVFRMGEARKQDTKYFQAMREILDEEGGNRLLLHYFKTFDLAKTDVNVAPKTEGLLNQKMNSLNTFYQWWGDCLSDGQILFAENVANWVLQIDKEVFRNAYKRYLKDRNINGNWLPNDISVGKKLKQCCPSVVTDQQRRNGDHFMKVYRLPPLEQARKEWEQFIGHVVDWK